MGFLVDVEVLVVVLVLEGLLVRSGFRG